ncbi:MAG: hypothetical protein LBM98_05695 [Oscillospiraceae bacterium]|jgi:hypothetical protein|nr:hypothetical protein [Oscillospiraceae bacterium]
MFSKLVLASTIVMHFLALLLVVWIAVRCVILSDMSNAALLASAIVAIEGVSAAVGFAFYSNKAKAENLVKIAQSLTKEEVDEVAELANSLGGMQ